MKIKFELGDRYIGTIDSESKVISWEKQDSNASIECVGYVIDIINLAIRSISVLNIKKIEFSVE